MQPALTTVRQPIADIARAAARALLDEVRGEHRPRAEYVFRPVLVVRASTTVPAVTVPVRVGE
jgi:DNA-binding LacI/PurR family transcriptional regulator